MDGNAREHRSVPKSTILMWKNWWCHRKVRPNELNELNEVTAANAGKPLGFAGKSRVGLSPRPGVAEFRRYALS